MGWRAAGHAIGCDTNGDTNLGESPRTLANSLEDSKAEGLADMHVYELRQTPLST